MKVEDSSCHAWLCITDRTPLVAVFLESLGLGYTCLCIPFCSDQTQTYQAPSRYSLALHCDCVVTPATLWLHTACTSVRDMLRQITNPQNDTSYTFRWTAALRVSLVELKKHAVEVFRNSKCNIRHIDMDSTRPMTRKPLRWIQPMPFRNTLGQSSQTFIRTS